ncbi:hypothetical protein GPK56_07015 [Lactiplantibacillus plantarum]|nr:hypothetical protein [Lactiplantibacillus plantarum]
MPRFVFPQIIPEFLVFRQSLVSCLIILGITRFNVVSFNEAFWYFILFVRYIPFIVLIETIIFIFDLD